MWASGTFEKPDLRDVRSHFSHHKWGDVVDAYTQSLKMKTERAWVKMLTRAYAIMEEDNPNNSTIPYSSAQARASSGRVSGRALCVEPDSEPEEE